MFGNSVGWIEPVMLGNIRKLGSVRLQTTNIHESQVQRKPEGGKAPTEDRWFRGVESPKTQKC